MEDQMPPDLQAEYDALIRRRKIADALLQRADATQPLTHWTQGVAKLYNAYKGNELSKEVSAQEADLKARRAQDEKAQMDKFIQAMTPEPTRALESNEQGPPEQGLTRPLSLEKVKNAYIEAQLSPYQNLRKTAELQQGFMEKDQARQEAVQARKDRDAYLASEKQAFQDRLDAEKRAERERDWEKYLQKVRIEGNTASEKLKRANAVRFAQMNEKSTAAIDAANEATDSVKTSLQFLDDGIYTGTGADWRKAGAKALGLVGGDTTKAANTEQFMASVGNTIIPLMKSLGANPTDKDLIYMQKVSAGDINMEEAALRGILARLQAKLESRIANMSSRMPANAAPSIATTPPAAPTVSNKTTAQKSDDDYEEEARKRNQK